MMFMAAERRVTIKRFFPEIEGKQTPFRTDFDCLRIAEDNMRDGFWFASGARELERKANAEAEGAPFKSAQLFEEAAECRAGSRNSFNEAQKAMLDLLGNQTEPKPFDDRALRMVRQLRRFANLQAEWGQEDLVSKLKVVGNLRRR